MTMTYLIPDAAALEAQISDLKDAWLRDIRTHQDQCPATFSNCVPHDCGCGLTELREAEMGIIESLNSQPTKPDCGWSIKQGGRICTLPKGHSGFHDDAGVAEVADAADLKSANHVGSNPAARTIDMLQLRRELDPDAPDAVVIGDRETCPDCYEIGIIRNSQSPKLVDLCLRHASVAKLEAEIALLRKTLNTKQALLARFQASAHAEKQ